MKQKGRVIEVIATATSQPENSYKNYIKHVLNLAALKPAI
jgi:hypothetical protein